MLTAAVLTLGLAAGAMAADAPTTGTSNEVDKTKSQSIPAAKVPKTTTAVTTNASGTAATSDTKTYKKSAKLPISWYTDGPPKPPPPPPPPPK